jgi:hypothetical protein
MIIITGPGRGGTSLIAKLYQQLGFDPGGEWIEGVNAGLEREEIVRANGLIVRDLRVSALSSRAAAERFRREDAVWGQREGAPNRVVASVRRVIETAALRALGRTGEQLELIPWERYDAVVERYAPSLVELSQRLEVAKDPVFCWTLDAWAKAGARIDHVVFCVRDIDATVESRLRAQQVLFKHRGAAKNSFIYGMGLCLAALHDHRLPYSIIQFPDFTDDPERLYDQLRFPRPVARSDFLDAFGATVRKDLVHDHR